MRIGHVVYTIKENELPTFCLVVGQEGNGLKVLPLLGVGTDCPTTVLQPNEFHRLDDDQLFKHIQMVGKASELQFFGQKLPNPNKPTQPQTESFSMTPGSGEDTEEDETCPDCGSFLVNGECPQCDSEDNAAAS